MSFGNIKLGTKIYLGFGMLLLLLIAVGIVSWSSLDNANTGFTDYRGLARETNLAGRLQANMLMVRMNVKDYILTGSDKDKEQFESYLKKMQTYLERATKEIKEPKRAALVKKVVDQVTRYETAFKQVVEKKTERNRLLSQVLNKTGPEMERSLSAIMKSANGDNDAEAAYFAGQALRALLLARLYVVKFLDDNKQSSADRVRQEFGTFQKLLSELTARLENPARKAMLAQLKERDGAYLVAFNKLVETIFARNELITGTLDKLGPQIAADVEEVTLSLKKEQDQLGPKLQSENGRSIMIIGVILGLALLFGLLTAFFMTRGITRQIRAVVAGLAAGAEQVAAASGQVSSSSQSLAEGASEQASALEETSASLEELASMTKQNADNAQQADGLMKEAAAVVAEANQSMSQLKEAMDRITSASDETAKIIKTIDEIAFQTNLLALNAAVEAARAGEAGAGFAVVADEVRNLAMRAAEAAKTTSSLIEGNLDNIRVGSEMVAATDESFGEVVSNAQKVGELVGEIAAASTEQAQGIDQITKAASEMEKVTQQVAANAEESAAASEELSAQAQTMNGHVDDLVGLVNGQKAASGGYRQVSDGGEGRRAGRRALPSPKPARPQTKGHLSSFKREQAPEDVIPLDDGDFSDF